MNHIGLLAGVGRLPVDFARAARGMGFAVTAVAVVPGVDEELPGVVDAFYEISAGELSKVLELLREKQISKVTMLGKVTKETLFNGTVRPDARMAALLAGLKDYSDDTIMMALVRELAAAGVETMDQTAMLRLLLPEPGPLTQRVPNAEQQADLEFGMEMARKIGGLDIGQTVVVKNRAVMAVEAIEGTDACIRRGGQLGRGSVRVAKTAKPDQDIRFDMPAVGPSTIAAMAEAGADCLALEAGKTLLVDREKTLELAERHGIAIIAIP
ncbi:MAG TPA: UDP-2,3-diacylglucosamine diphosphatase LpxI [Patescibacteria group bacterium]|nr:UDP-2,3-diacylglucosamine diphosphatase LpxI [Patescibacteria group bacterium]